MYTLRISIIETPAYAYDEWYIRLLFFLRQWGVHARVCQGIERKHTSESIDLFFPLLCPPKAFRALKVFAGARADAVIG